MTLNTFISFKLIKNVDFKFWRFTPKVKAGDPN